ncbi:MAG: hypothetical protein J0I20_35695 [Chloroflexi bacterium]|nr:hypothetical protein [Chloroflexota bacterium]OJV86948.1 MAG: hypothetical protein BGO39_28510 [Chloroflexi bacterium 54-19]
MVQLKVKEIQAIGLSGFFVEQTFRAKFGFDFYSGQFTEDGQSNRVGKKFGAAVQLIGPVENLTNLGLIVPMSLDDPLSTIRAKKFLQTFFSFFPGADNGPTWVEGNIYEATTNGSGLTIRHNDLTIELNGIPTSNGLVFTLMVSKG